MKNRKMFAIVIGIASVMFMIIYTIVQYVGDWRGTFSWYIIGTLVVLYSIYELLGNKRKGVANKFGIFLMIITSLLILLFVGTLVFLYMYSR